MEPVALEPAGSWLTGQGFRIEVATLLQESLDSMGSSAFRGGYFTPQSSYPSLGPRCVPRPPPPRTAPPLGLPQPAMHCFWEGLLCWVGVRDRALTLGSGVLQIPRGLVCRGPSASWEAVSIRGTPPLVGRPPWREPVGGTPRLVTHLRGARGCRVQRGWRTSPCT